MVSVLTFYSDNPSSNSAEAFSFFCKMMLKRTKLNKKRCQVCLFLNLFFILDVSGERVARLWRCAADILTRAMDDKVSYIPRDQMLK